MEYKNFTEWVEQAPDYLKRDSVWHLAIYQKSVSLNEMIWLEKIVGNYKKIREKKRFLICLFGVLDLLVQTLKRGMVVVLGKTTLDP